MHFEKILSGFLKSVRDEDDRIAALVVESAEISGRFTDPQVWHDMIVPRLASPGLTVSEQTAQLIVLGALLRGADESRVCRLARYRLRSALVSVRLYRVLTSSMSTLQLQDGEILINICRATATENVSGVQNMETIDELFLLVRDILGRSRAFFLSCR